MEYFNQWSKYLDTRSIIQRLDSSIHPRHDDGKQGAHAVGCTKKYPQKTLFDPEQNFLTLQDIQYESMTSFSFLPFCTCQSNLGWVELLNPYYPPTHELQHHVELHWLPYFLQLNLHIF